MILEMKIPSPGESITEVEISSWLVKNGDYVRKDQVIAEISSDKATLELTAEKSGIITLKAKEGDTLQVGHIVCLIDMNKNADARIKQIEEKPIPTDELKKIPSPAARKILAEKNISYSQILGSGKEGRITKKDALKAIPAMGVATTGATRSFKIERISALRKKISERLVNVKNETAMLTTFNEIDMSEILSLRNRYQEQFKKQHGVGLGFMSFFVKSCVKAINLYPDINTLIDGESQIHYDFCDISIAISGPKGLMVPVLRNAEILSFRGIEQEIKRLASRVRSGKISVDEMSGGTFTITNGGVFGSMLSTPIINPPQSAILGMHNIVDRPVAINGEVKIRPIMYVALSYDHRIIDGRESVGFLVSVKEILENPIEILMERKIENALEL